MSLTLYSIVVVVAGLFYGGILYVVLELLVCHSILKIEKNRAIYIRWNCSINFCWKNIDLVPLKQTPYVALFSDFRDRSVSQEERKGKNLVAIYHTDIWCLLLLTISVQKFSNHLLNQGKFVANIYHRCV